jgi:fructose-1,6-bisphosphatase/inositol monophosphatase family enzyme
MEAKMIMYGLRHATITGVVRESGRILKQIEGSSKVLFEDSEDRSKFTTTADVLSLMNTVRGVMELYPQDGIIAEGLELLDQYKPVDDSEKELVDKILSALNKENMIPTRTGEYWAIDPLCGSTPHSRSIPDYIVSLGLINKKGEIQYGCIYNPNSDTIYFAEKGNGAFKYDAQSTTKMKVSNIKEINKQAFVSIEHKIIRENAVEIQPLTKQLKRLRVAGTCGLELALTANGNIDAVLKDSQPLYDYCAGLILVMEAGGTVTDYKGNMPNIQVGYNKCTNIVASNGLVHEQILQHINNL